MDQSDGKAEKENGSPILQRLLANEKRLIIGVLFLGLVVRLAYVLFSYEERWLSDAVEYEIIGRNIAQGDGFCFEKGTPTSFRPPLMPLFLAGIYSIFGVQNRTAVYIAQAIVGTGSILLVYLIADKFTGNKIVAALSSLVACFDCTLVELAGPSYTENLFIFLLLGSMYFALCGIEHNSLRAEMASGVFMGLSILTRPIALPLIAMWGLWLLARRNTPRNIIHGALFVSFSFLTIIPWTIRNYLVFDDFALVSTNGGYQLWQSHNLLPSGTVHTIPEVHERMEKRLAEMFAAIKAGADPHDVMLSHLATGSKAYFYVLGAEGEALLKEFDGLSEIETDKLLYKKAFHAIKERPHLFAKKVVKTFVRFWDPYGNREYFSGERPYALCYAIVAPMGFIGVLFGLKKWREFALPYITIAVLNGVCALHFIDPRYKLPMEPFLAIFASYIIVTLGSLGSWWSRFVYLVLTADVAGNLVVYRFGAEWTERIRAFVHGL